MLARNTFSRLGLGLGVRSPIASFSRSIFTVKATPAEENSILVAQRKNRPVSPHLQIYEKQLTAVFSALHRITGVGLAVGFYAVTVSYAAGIVDSASLLSLYSSIPVAESSSVNLNLTQPLPQSTPLQYFNDPSNTTVFIGGLNIPFTEKQMFDLFSKFGSISYVKIPQGKNCGFVQYFLRQSAEMAIIEMQGYDIGGGCKIRVSWGAKAAQRSWFARQLQMQQLEDQQSNQFNPQAQVQVQSHAQAQVQAQQAAQLQAQAQAQAQVQLQAQLQTQLQSQLQLQQHQQHQSLLGLDFSNSDINTLLNMSKNQNMSNNLGLYDSFDNSGIINNNNKNYSTTTGFQNDLIPFNSMNMGMNNYPNDELKLNKLLIAARDGNLDQLELGSNLYN